MPTSRPITNLAQARVIAGSLLMATIGYAVVGTVLILLHILPENGLSDMEERTAFLVKTVLLVAGVAAASGSFLIRRILDGRAPAGPEGLPVRFRNMIVGMALGESAGVMGFVVALLTGDTTFSLLLWGAAVVTCMLHFPTQALVGAQDSPTDR
jgi:hypothetical protein